MFGQFIEVVTYGADVDEVTGREVYPAWVLYALGFAAFLATFGTWASVS